MAMVKVLRKKNRHGVNGLYLSRCADYLIDLDNNLYVEEYFNDLLLIERRRTERSKNPFLFVLLDINQFQGDKAEKQEVTKKIADCLFSVTRETDMKGWYRYDSVIGAIFTEVCSTGGEFAATRAQLSDKLHRNLSLVLSADQLKKIAVSWHVFPDRFNKAGSDGPGCRNEQTNPLIRKPRKKAGLLMKRMVDIAGSLFFLVMFGPLFVGIAALIKLSSEGPVLFRQERVGSLERTFMFLKFRSMYVNNDPTVHKEFIKKFMAAGNSGAGADGVYKLTQDPRVTPIGRFLRKTSLDELPQFINVLKGDMSLVGPRPPIPYECEDYDIWHRRRVLEMKPGITGYWQVNGRSTTTFDEMVRMDIKYMREWSLVLDLKILFQTPVVVLTGKGGY